jgi:protein-disulfide isomerase
VAQARKTAKPARNSLSAFYWVLGVVAVVGIGVIAWIVLKGHAASAAAEPVAVAGADNPQALVQMAKGVTQGKDDAPAKMLVFSDFQCPFCSEFARNVEPQLVNQFVPSGKLQFVYYDFPLGGAHKYSFLAARAARCAGEQGKFWQYHDVLFGRQNDWAAEETMPLKSFLEYGNQLGLDKGKFQTCVESNKYQDIVSANRVLGDKLGVNATPTIYINGKRVPVEMTMDAKKIGDLINREAGLSAPQSSATTPPTTTGTH